MKKWYYASFIYLVLGLLGGLFYREFTKAHDFHGETQLGVVHTHLLVLGFIVPLVFLALDRLFNLSEHKTSTIGFWLYNAGVLVTVGMMITHGIMTVNGSEVSPAISGIAGLGHILMTISTILLMSALGSAISTSQARDTLRNRDSLGNPENQPASSS